MFDWRLSGCLEQPGEYNRAPIAFATDSCAVDVRERRPGERSPLALPHVVALLPGTMREAEARRNLDLPALATRPPQRLPYAAFLPWEESRAVLEPFLRDPDPDLRAIAWPALIGVVRYHRDQLPDLLSLIRSRLNEQDPIRGAILRGIADLPPVVWGRGTGEQAGQLSALAEIIRGALNAADLSESTAIAAEGILWRLLPVYPDWAVDQLRVVVEERGRLQIQCWPARPAERDTLRLAQSLMPVLASWQTKEREGALLQAAEHLGHWLDRLDGLADILASLAHSSANAYYGEHALKILARHRRERLADLVPALLREDPSWITRPVVYQYLSDRRQDLLTPFLGQKPVRGRFATGRTRFALPVNRGLFRWTPAQQEVFAATLAGLIAEPNRDTPAVLRAIGQLAAMPAISPDRLVRETRTSHPRPAVRDAALRQMGRLDAGQGVPALLDAMRDERARIAIYALRRALTEMPSSRAVGVLRQVSLEKVTVAKEVLRLLGDLRCEEAFAALLAQSAADLHRDVRVALLRALWGYLDHEESWGLLEEAAASPDPAIAASVARVPADRLSLDGQRRLADLLTKLVDHPESRVRLDALRRCQDLPVSDPGRRLLPSVLQRLGSPLPDEVTAAANAAFFGLSAPEDAVMVAAAMESVAAERRAFAAAMRSLETALRGSRRALVPVARRVCARLAGDPLLAQPVLALAVQAIPWNELPAFLERLRAAGGLHADTLSAAITALPGAAADRPDAEGLESLERVLAASEEDRLRRLALAALVARAQSGGWTPERRERLEVYRSDPSPLVAGAAQFTFPPAEARAEASSAAAPPRPRG